MSVREISSKKYLPTLFSPLLDRRHIMEAIIIVRTSVSRNEISFGQKVFVTFITQKNKNDDVYFFFNY